MTEERLLVGIQSLWATRDLTVVALFISSSGQRLNVAVLTIFCVILGFLETWMCSVFANIHFVQCKFSVC